jgi:hypothetical protein
MPMTSGISTSIKVVAANSHFQERHQVLSPGVQDGQEAELRTQALGFRSHFQERLGHGPKEQAVRHFREIVKCCG